MHNVTVTSPKGFECTGDFRAPRVGEYYLCSDGFTALNNCGLCSHPRVILRPTVTTVRADDLKMGDFARILEGPYKGAIVMRAFGGEPVCVVSGPGGRPKVGDAWSQGMLGSPLEPVSVTIEVD